MLPKLRPGLNFANVIFGLVFRPLSHTTRGRGGWGTPCIYKGHDAAGIIVMSDPLKYIGEFLVNLYLKQSQCFSLACSFT